MTLPANWPGNNFWWHFIVFTLIVIVFVFGMAMVFIYLERRGSGRFQARVGPNRTGPFGVMQPVADAVKALAKETITPDKADKWVYWLAPVVAFAPVMMVFAVIPLFDGAMLADLNIGILYIAAISSVSIVGLVMAGWASNNKYSLLGAMRVIAQVVSYEIPLGLAILSVVLLAGSLSLTDIVNAQNIPFILLQPLGFLVFYMASSAEINRSPFDLLEAESEIVAGYNIEYSGMKFALFYLVEYCEALAMSAIIATIFLGGWRGPFLWPILWFLIKVVAVFFLIVWVRSTLPRLRIDQVMGFAWKFLLPVSLLNVFITAVQVVYFPTLQWPIIIINFVVLIVLVVLWSRLYRFGSRLHASGGGRVEL